MADKTFTCSKDAVMGKTIGGSFSGWNGQDSHLQIGATTSIKWRSVVYFPVNFSGMLTITSATLHLVTSANSNHQDQYDPPTTLKVARMTKDWGEGAADPGEGNLTSTLTWEWDNRFDSYTNTGSNTKSLTQNASGTEETIDVTDIVTAWFNGSNNYGIILINDSSESETGKALQFFSSEVSGNKPYLVVEYETNTAPDAPDLTSPDGDIITSLVPTMSGVMVDIDPGDYLTGVHILVYSPVYEYDFEASNFTNIDPGTTDIGLNNASASAATILRVNETTADGRNIASTLGTWDTLYDSIILVNRLDPEQWVRYNTSGTSTDNGTWHSIPITLVESTLDTGTTFADNADVFVFLAHTTDDWNVGSTAMWNSGIIPITGRPTTFSIPYGSTSIAEPLTGGKTYGWYARTADKEGVWSPFSKATFFTPNSPPNAPSITVPSPSNDVKDDTPDFTLTHSDPDPRDDLMYGYQIVVEKETSPGSGSWGTTGGWDSGQIDASGSPATTKVVTSGTLTWGGSYRVKARTKDKLGSWSSYSAWQAFTVHGAGIPINLDPSSDEVTTLTPTFSAERRTTADNITSYEIVVYSDDLATTKWSSGVLTSGITGGATINKTYGGSTLLAATAYRWKIRVTSTIGGTSSYSSLQRFITASDPSVPTLSAPITTGITLTPSLVGSRVATFNKYDIEVYPSTATSGNLGTAHKTFTNLTTGITAAGLGYQFSYAYNGSPALEYNTTYKWRARVSDNNGSTWTTWSGLATFTTDAAGVPALTSVAAVSYPTFPWITDSTPTFLITRSGSDTIYQARFRVWNAAHTVMIWDSGMQGSYGGSTTASFTYNGTALIPGTTYSWDASYRKTSLSGPTGGYATYLQFRLNSPPRTPSNLFPTPGYVWADSTILFGSDLLPTFKAEYTDPDVVGYGDTPTEWEIVVESWNGSTWAAVGTENIVTGLAVGINTYEWGAADADFTSDEDYRWRTRFKDSKAEWGPYSGDQSFRIATTPNGTILTPSDDSTLSTVNPEVTWSYTGGTQERFKIDIDRVTSDGTFEANVFSTTKVSAVASYDIPGGYMKQDKYYRIKLTVINTDGLEDPTPSEVQVLVLLDPPNPITGLSVTTDTLRSLVTLNWDTVSLKTGHSFVAYNIYRRLSGQGDAEWNYAGSVTNRANSNYNDWKAGHGIMYQYRVTNLTTKTGVAIEMESPDDPDGGSFSEVKLDTDVWQVIGRDRSDSNISYLPVTSESHNRPVQQEAFETLGSNRKVIIKGFVLGFEGSLDMTWVNQDIVHPLDEQEVINETIWGRRILDNMIHETGFWILKSPFGDVWEVTFGSPNYEWIPGGNLNVSIDWTETGPDTGNSY